MEREGRLSHILQKGVCGKPTKNGFCNRVRGDCPFHAEPELRCASCLDADSTRRCSLRKENGSEYCSNHAAFPNFGKVLKGYAEECRSKGVPFSPDAFREACYPNVTELPPGNLHAIVGALLCLPAGQSDLAENVGQPRQTSANLGQPAPEREQRKPPSEAPGMRTARRHRQAITKELKDGTLRLDPTLPHADAFEAEVARRCALTDSRRGVWGQAARQKLHVTREADRVIGAVGQHTTSEADRVIREVPQALQHCFAMELDKRLGPAPADEMEEVLVDRARANKRIRELRKEGKTNSVQSGVDDPAAPAPPVGHEQRAEPRHAKRRKNDRGTDGAQLTLEMGESGR